MTVTKIKIGPIASKEVAVPQPEEESTSDDLLLPEGPKDPDTDLRHYTVLLYGREKIGKTTVAASFPEALFFLTEPGGKGLRIASLNDAHGGVKNWDILRSGVDLLEKNPSKYKTVVIDTVDRAYDMCLEWVCKNWNIEYPGETEDGEQDFGKSWKAVKTEFLRQIHRIIQSGRGIVFTSHVVEQSIKPKGGEKYTQVIPSMSSQARKVVEALVDLFFYAEYYRDKNGDIQRVFVCRGDETIRAGARDTGSGKEFPAIIPMGKNDGYDIILRAFRGEDVGLDPLQFYASKQTSQTGQQYLTKERMKANEASKNTNIPSTPSDKGNKEEK